MTKLDQNQEKTWQRSMREAVTDPAELWRILELPESELKAAYAAHALFPLKVPMGFIQRMHVGNLNDPLLRQVLPLDAETKEHHEFTHDPVADLENNPTPGIIHKYHGRALLIATGACAVHCRYCFRRHFPYNEQTASRSSWHEALTYIKNDQSIHEVILSGGDPLSLSDKKLANLFAALEQISHVKTIRLHTRHAIVLPERIDDGFIETIKLSSKNIVMVMHANHVNELDHSVTKICAKLKDAEVTLLNQSVLLRGVNDNSQNLTELSHGLFAAGILPYYLNQLDQVSGAAHFAVSNTEALDLHKALKINLPGYLVPKLVQDLTNNAYKTWIAGE